ncbi:acetoacetate metabolism regulatory protein AtoC [Spirochaetia bacterium]|nr:acetoacetate metabolism regulatory protein AtoC [Spirochaetia bacterium]GHU35599.1 acetoacetate metabolism regulatory protein AtoC [Spirochaetia bacterium]
MRVLIVDDEKNIRLSLVKYLALEQIDAAGVESGEAALATLKKEDFDAVILDLKLPGMSGQAVLEWIRNQGLVIPVLMISAHGQIADAVQTLKSGAQDYLVKPFDPADLVIKIRLLVEPPQRKTGKLIGETLVMQQLSRDIDKLAAADVTILITGESGTGKEIVAREIHERSPAAHEPFVAVNIGGMHENLMESELFGHEKGAFTGAVARKQGLFESAGRGTLFLDEIGEMPLSLQVKLLRVLQERKIRRLGGVQDIPVHARIISATNRNLETLIKENRFREDLYYRLNVFRIELAPLRDRIADIPLLAAHLLAKISSRSGRTAPTLDPSALKKLEAYSFPGNIRELENILERAFLYCEGTIIRADVLGDLVLQNAAEPDGSSLETIEKNAIRNALDQCKGNRTKAAEMLGISRKTILNKIKAYQL